MYNAEMTSNATTSLYLVFSQNTFLNCVKLLYLNNESCWETD